MQDRFKFKAIVKGYYYIDTPDKCEEFKPLIFLENIDVLDIGDIGIPEEDLEIAIRKQYSDLQDIYTERMMENFRDNSNGVDTYMTITPERVYQCTGLKDKNGKLIYEGDILQCNRMPTKVLCEWFKDGFWVNYFINGAKRELRNMHNWYEVIGNIYENPELLED